MLLCNLDSFDSNVLAIVITGSIVGQISTMKTMFLNIFLINFFIYQTIFDQSSPTHRFSIAIINSNQRIYRVHSTYTLSTVVSQIIVKPK